MPTSLALMALLMTSTAASNTDAGAPPRCLYVSSYHAGYEWNDGIERGLESVLQGHCELRRFYMDGKRHLDAGFASDRAREAKALIDRWQPHVVIACDDNASKYLVMPYLKDAAVPVVFCGINWTAEPYGYPYRNTTGMIEVGPIEPLVREVREVTKGARRGMFVAADEITQYKEFEMSRQVYGRLGISISLAAVRTMDAWEAAFTAAEQSADFIVLGNNAGIVDWDDARARRHTLAHTRRFTVAYLEWMAPYSMLTMAKLADEQGEWAGKAAVQILDGTPPAKIPIVANRRWNMFVNPHLLQAGGFRLPPELLRKAVKVGE